MTSYPLQHRHVQTTADFHSLSPIERDRRVIVGKYVQDRNLSPRRNPLRNGAKQELCVAAAAVIWMHADRGNLRVVNRLHPLPGHRNKLPIDPDAKERP